MFCVTMYRITADSSEVAIVPETRKEPNHQRIPIVLVHPSTETITKKPVLLYYSYWIVETPCPYVKQSPLRGMPRTKGLLINLAPVLSNSFSSNWQTHLVLGSSLSRELVGSFLGIRWFFFRFGRQNSPCCWYGKEGERQQLWSWIPGRQNRAHRIQDLTCWSFYRTKACRALPCSDRMKWRVGWGFHWCLAYSPLCLFDPLWWWNCETSVSMSDAADDSQN